MLHYLVCGSVEVESLPRSKEKQKNIDYNGLYISYFIMDNESDGEEFYDATEDFSSVSTPVEEGSTITSCQDFEPPTRYCK